MLHRLRAILISMFFFIFCANREHSVLLKESGGGGEAARGEGEVPPSLGSLGAIGGQGAALSPVLTPGGDRVELVTGICRLSLALGRVDRSLVGKVCNTQPWLSCFIAPSPLPKPCLRPGFFLNLFLTEPIKKFW